MKQVAVYKPGSISNEKRSLKHGGHVHRHQVHQYLHNRQVQEINERKIEKRSVGQLIAATIDGQVDSWINSYSGPAVVASSMLSPVGAQLDEVNVSASDRSTSKTGTIEVTSSLSPITRKTSLATTKVTTTSPGHLSKPTSSIKTGHGPATDQGWTRQAYYDAASGTAEGITFLNHYGGTDGIPGTAAGGSA